ncbi:MAG: LysE family transporter [Microbacteriaceae bacterium]|nr:LysE family transporter [Microbacteriaceae bacterium]
MELGTWLLYTAAAAGLSLTPGPNGLLALTHGALFGIKKTSFTIAGGALGFTAIIALSLFGIGALLAASAQLLIVLKWIGGAYLVWLGIQVWRSPAVGASLGDSRDVPSRIRLFRHGFLAAVSNPKGILFFVAFLPQFLVTDSPLIVQFAVMAGTFVAIEIITEALIALGSERIQPFLAKFGSRVNQVFGGIFIAIGIALPLRS